MNGSSDKKLFWACFIALIATAFGFIIRVLIMDDWATQFGLDETQKGQIFGVGLWPFAISIVLFSLIIDRIGYGPAMIFAFFCHAASIAITVAVPDLAGGDKDKAYWWLYAGNFICALGNGTVEAVINPVVATMFARDKTKWLNMLHAGWPGGLVLGGVLALSLGEYGVTDWRIKIGLLGIPVLLYGILMVGCTFPVNERVTAGVSYRKMLGEVGFLGALVVTTLITLEVTNVLTQLKLLFQDPSWLDTAWKGTLPLLGEVEFDKAMQMKLIIILTISFLFGLYTLSLGRIIFFILLLIMIPLATTELGVDSWVGDLMGPEMKKAGLPGLSVLIYTSFIMMVLRFFAGPIIHRLSPLGLLAVCSAIAAVGLFTLSSAAGVMILVAATLYGIGKTFFWPTMLGVVAERFPKGGALTLNITGGVGMLAVGILGNPLLGNIQDKTTDSELAQKYPAIYAKAMAEPKQSVFGEYKPLDAEKVKLLPADQQEEIKKTREAAKKSALRTVAIFPIIMLCCYLLLMLYFKARGGYHAETIGHDPH